MKFETPQQRVRFVFVLFGLRVHVFNPCNASARSTFFSNLELLFEAGRFRTSVWALRTSQHTSQHVDSGLWGNVVLSMQLQNNLQIHKYNENERKRR